MTVDWKDANRIDPPETEYSVQYFTTIYNEYFRPTKTKTMILSYKVEYDKYNNKKNVWTIGGNKLPSTWQVTHWDYKPEPAWDGEQ